MIDKFHFKTFKLAQFSMPMSALILPLVNLALTVIIKPLIAQPKV
jgi:hypothetical protein